MPYLIIAQQLVPETKQQQPEPSHNWIIVFLIFALLWGVGIDYEFPRTVTKVVTRTVTQDRVVYRDPLPCVPFVPAQAHRHHKRKASAPTYEVRPITLKMLGQ